MMPLAIRRRQPRPVAGWPGDLHPLLARVYAARGLSPADLARSRLAHMAAPEAIGGTAGAAAVLAEAIERNLAICVVGDFDCDGATGTAVAVRGLRLLGARRVGFRVPNRAREGYGLTPALVESLAGADCPDLLLTVDNGIASLAGVTAANALGMRVVVTDHHLPGAELPAAAAIVNPQLRPAGDAATPDLRGMAGVGVVFYLLLALRRELRARGRFGAAGSEPDLSTLLDLVALGTVADLVPLDGNNRILVAAGLRRIRSGHSCPGVAALFRAARRDPARAVAADLGFAIGPRINAAGRLEDMRVGIECLLADDATRAEALALQLSGINGERQELQTTMVEEAEALVAAFLAERRSQALPHGVVLHDPGWHPGVVGLVASRLKERLNRPVIACAPATPGSDELRGSARSIGGFHVRDALAEVDARCPGLIARFGGHAMAAGLSLAAGQLARFAAEFERVAGERIDPAALERVAWSDGELAAGEFSHEAAHALRYAGPWGQGFAEPAFDNTFDVESWRMVGEKHLKLRVRPDGGEALDAILFNAPQSAPPPARIRALFQLDLNEWNGRESLQLLVRHIEPA
jgi:single-stranded-DNA-specific exonuclease